MFSVVGKSTNFERKLELVPSLAYPQPFPSCTTTANSVARPQQFTLLLFAIVPFGGLIQGFNLHNKKAP